MNEDVITLYDEGKPFSEIAVLCGKTRGQVAGIIFRYRKHSTPKPEKPEVEVIIATETEKGVDLMNLKPHSCRFPTFSNGNSHLFCGDTIHTGSYCEKHYKLTHTAIYIKPKAKGHYR